MGSARPASKPSSSPRTSSTRADLRHCGIAELDLEPESVDLLLTDPPYPAEYDGLLGDLASLASCALKPGGSAIIMLGHRQLPAAFAAFAPHDDLRYRWTLCYDTRGGGNARIWPLKLWTVWKPLVWWAKGPAQPRRWREDGVLGVRAKELHEWQQGVSPFIDLVLGFSDWGGAVCDPFLGAGTTAVAAVLNGRRFVGCDVDPTCIRKSTARVLAAEEYLDSQRRLATSAET